MSDTTPRPDEPTVEPTVDVTADAPPPPPPPPPPPAEVPPASPAEAPAYAQPAYPASAAQPGAEAVPYAAGPRPMSPQDERTTGMAAHGVALAATVISAGLLSFVVALVMYLVFRDRGPFVRHHAANALNVQIIAGIVFVISIPLMFVLIGFVTFGAAWLFAVIVHIIGAVKANNGEWYNPPLTPNFVK